MELSTAAFAQSPTVTPSPPSPIAAKPESGTEQPVLTVEKLTQDLQNAGFTDVKVLDDAFLIRAKTKSGNPILMNIGSDGMSALEFPKRSGASKERTGQAVPDSGPAAGASKSVKQ